MVKNLHPKVKAGGVAGIVATVIVAIAGALGIGIPQGVSDALVTLVAFLAGYRAE